jgi:hypothetical protein
MARNEAAALRLGIEFRHGADADAEAVGEIAMRRQARPRRERPRADIARQRIEEARLQGGTARRRLLEMRKPVSHTASDFVI